VIIMIYLKAVQWLPPKVGHKKDSAAAALILDHFNPRKAVIVPQF